MSILRQFFYNNRWFLLIALLSLLLKVALLLQGEVVNRDGALYIAAAEKHAQGLFSEGFAYYSMPFYPLLLSAIHFVIPDWILAGQLLTIIPIVLALWPLYALTQRLFNQQSALWTVLLLAILPEFNTLSIMRDPLFLLFVLSALVFLLICYQDRQLIAIAGFVLFAVLAVLTRIEGVLLFVIAPVMIFFSWRYVKESDSNQNRLIIIMILIPMALALVLWGLDVAGLVANSRLNEVSMWVKDLISLKFFAGYQQLMQSIRELQKVLPGANYHNNLLEVTRHYAPLIYCVGLVEVLGKAVFPTSLLALLAFRWRKSKNFLSSDHWLILLPWIGFILLNILFLVKQNFIQVRYLWIPIVLSLPWIGSGISLWWQEWQQRKIVATLVIALIIIAPLSKTVALAAKPQDTTIVNAGLWLQDYDPLRQIAILYNDRRLPLYADRVSEVFKVRSLNYLHQTAYCNEEVEILALYLSNKQKEEYSISEFEPLKVFKGPKKTVVFLKRL